MLDAETLYVPVQITIFQHAGHNPAHVIGHAATADGNVGHLVQVVPDPRWTLHPAHAKSRGSDLAERSIRDHVA